MQRRFETYSATEAEAVVLELYVPYRVEFLSPLFAELHRQLTSHEQSPLFRGFSMYEVKGAFRSGQPGAAAYQELTLVVRLIFDAQEFEGAITEPAPTFVTGIVNGRLRSLAQILVESTGYNEEEVWILRMETGATRLMKIAGQEG